MFWLLCIGLAPGGTPLPGRDGDAPGVLLDVDGLHVGNVDDHILQGLVNADVFRVCPDVEILKRFPFVTDVQAK